MNKNSAEEKIVENLDKPDDTLTEVVIDNKKIEENGIEDNKVDGKGDVEKTLEVLLTFLLFVLSLRPNSPAPNGQTVR